MIWATGCSHTYGDDLQDKTQAIDLIVSGGSITHGGWYTWKDFVSERYKIKPINLAQKGQGNEVITTKAILESCKYENPIVIVMLTSVDKWDWYVQDPSLLDKLRKEKHTPQLTHAKDKGGFWSTGSWFPLEKEYYWKNYYSLNYQIMKTCLQINHLRTFFTTKKLRHLILFDSPIFEYTEQELNQNPVLSPKSLINETTEPFLNLVGDYDRGLIGYCHEKDLPWFHPKHKWHPGSLVHFKYSCDYIFPILDQWLHVYDTDLHLVAEKMDKLWYE